MSLEDAFFNSLRRRSRLRADKVAEDLSFHNVALSDIHSSLRSYDSNRKTFGLALERDIDQDNSQGRLRPGLWHAAREMSPARIAEEEHAADQCSSRRPHSSEDATNQLDVQNPIDHGPNLAFRRRERYRLISPNVRRCAPPASPRNTPADEPDVLGENGIERDRGKDPDTEDSTLERLFQFRRTVSARSTVDYLQLETRAYTASLVCRLITTAEHERRTKQRARIWRKDTSKIKARHVRASISINQEADWLRVSGDSHGDALVTSLASAGYVRSDVDDATCTQHDSQADRLYDGLWKTGINECGDRV